MKFRITMKDPDGVYESISSYLETTRPEGLSDEEWEDIEEERRNSVESDLAEWFEYGELIVLEVDLVKGTCIVASNKK